MDEQKNHSRLTNLLFNTCSDVMRALLPSLLKSQKDCQNMSVDEYVKIKKHEISKTKIGQRHFYLLYPTRRRQTDLQKWSLQLLFFIVEDIMHPEPNVKQALGILKSIRNDLCHGPSTFVSNEKYMQHLQTIMETQDKLLQIVGDDAMTQKITTLGKEIINDKWTSRDSLDTLMDWLESDKNLLEERCTFSKDHMEVLENLMSICGNAKIQGMKVPDTKLVIKLANCTTEQEDTICRRFVDVVNGETKKLQSDEFNAEISRIVEKTFKEVFEGHTLVKAELGCVIMTVQSRTFMSLGRLITHCVNGELTKAFDKIQSYLRKTYQNQMTIDVMLPLLEFLKVIQKTINSLPDESNLEVHPYPGAILEVAAVDNHEATLRKAYARQDVTVVLRPQSDLELVYMIGYIESGKLDEELHNMKLKVGQDLKEHKMSINTKFCELDTTDLKHVESANTIPLPIQVWRNGELGDQQKDAVLCLRKTIQMILKQIDKKSRLFERLVFETSKYIKSLSQSILKVTACYDHRERETVVFLVIFDRELGNTVQEKLSHLNVHLMQTNSVNNESKVALFNKRNMTEHFTKEEDEKLKRCIAKESKELLQNHSNITMISANNVKSKGFCKDKHEMISKACIVLFVPVKGLIPISEEPFPPEIGNYPTDVMEGTFSLFGKTPQDFHETLKTGCQITCEQTNLQGTVGPFITLGENGIGFLTCAHNVYDINMLNQLNFENGRADITHLDVKVYQPDHTNGQNVLGYATHLFCRDGNDDCSSSMEVAVVELKNRIPESGSFPECSAHLRGDNGFCNSNEVYTGEAFKAPKDVTLESEVVMFGSQSGATTGILHTLSSTVPFTENKSLNGQILITGVSQNIPFAKYGDSGAGVFMRKCNGSLKLIGLLVGGMPGNCFIVTPIWEIVKAIGCELLTFTPDGNRKKLSENELSNLRKSVEDVKSSLGETNNQIVVLQSQMQQVISALKVIMEKR